MTGAMPESSINFPATQRHRPLTGIKLHCLETLGNWPKQ